LKLLPLLRRLALGLAATLLFAGAAVAGIIAYPEPLYAHHVEHGRLRLYSDRPFDHDNGRALLAEVERRLAAAPPDIRDPDSVFRVIVSNSEWRRRLTFLWNYGVGGVNYYPPGGAVFIRQADIDAGLVLKGNGTPVALPRNFAYYASHEIAHSLVGRRVGAIANWQLPVWIKEGLCDYVAFGGEVDIETLTRALRAGDRDLDPKRSGLYARYRLLVAYFLQREHWTADRLLNSGLSQAEAESMLERGVPAS
jgi:hypothetical protein